MNRESFLFQEVSQEDIQNIMSDDLNYTDRIEESETSWRKKS